MSENTEPREPGAYDAFLAERLSRMQAEHPEWLRSALRVHLIQALRDDTQIERQQIFPTVDDFLARHGLGQPPFSPKAAVLAVLVGLVVILAPLALLYFLWRGVVGR